MIYKVYQESTGRYFPIVAIDPRNKIIKTHAAFENWFDYSKDFIFLKLIGNEWIEQDINTIDLEIYNSFGDE